MCQCVCQSVTRLRPAKTAERIDVLFGGRLLGAQKPNGHLVLVEGPDFRTAREWGFDAAFAVVLWPLFKLLLKRFTLIILLL